MFDIDYFRRHPEPFYVLAKELYPGQFHPTVSHAFIALLARKGKLFMNFTQNIDCLERRAGVPSDLIIEAHGSFAAQRCIECRAAFPDDEMKHHVERGEVPRCAKSGAPGGCDGLVKPDIVFFGEALPERFRSNTHMSTTADLVVVIGTSLTVYPFAGLPEYARSGVPRVLFNKERVGQMGSRPDDVLELGACDDGVRKLASLLGWRDELEALWREVVGDKEAERQLATAEGRGHDEIDEEVKKLTEEVESALKIGDDDSPRTSDVEAPAKDEKVDTTTQETQPADQTKDENKTTSAEESDAEKPDAEKPTDSTGATGAPGASEREGASKDEATKSPEKEDDSSASKLS